MNINNLVIVGGGDISFEKFSKSIKPIVLILNNKKAFKLKQVKFITQNKDIIQTKDTKQAYIYFASPLNISYNDKQLYKAKVASFILGSGGFGSRLMEEIRVKKGLAYSAYGYNVIEKSHSYFTGYLQTKLQSQQEAILLVKKVISDFIKNGVTQEELDSAKQFILGSEPLRVETFSQRLNRSFRLYYKGLKLNYPQEELNKIKNLTLDELNSFIKEHKEIKKLSFSIVTNKSNNK